MIKRIQPPTIAELLKRLCGAQLFDDLPSLQRELLGKDPSNFVSHYILEPVPHAFNGDLSLWIDWKSTLSRLIDVDSKDIVLTGSGAIGYSLNPAKEFRPFDSNSDIDCGIISSYYFEVAWRYLRQLRVSWLTLDRKSKVAIEMHRSNYVFSGTIATDRILALLPFGQRWQQALDAVSGVPPTAGRDVKLRIYKDYDALRSYQAHNVGKLRDGLAATPDEEPIGTE